MYLTARKCARIRFWATLVAGFLTFLRPQKGRDSWRRVSAQAERPRSPVNGTPNTLSYPLFPAEKLRPADSWRVEAVSFTVSCLKWSSLARGERPWLLTVAPLGSKNAAASSPPCSTPPSGPLHARAQGPLCRRCAPHRSHRFWRGSPVLWPRSARAGQSAPAFPLPSNAHTRWHSTGRR